VINKAVSFFLLLAQQPPVGQYLLIHEILDHTRRTTVSRTPLDGGPALRRDLYLATHNTEQTSMPPVGFETTVWAGVRTHTYALDRGAAGTGKTVSRMVYCRCKYFIYGHRDHYQILTNICVQHCHGTGSVSFFKEKRGEELLTLVPIARVTCCGFRSKSLSLIILKVDAIR
jgi:hypothetical protein